MTLEDTLSKGHKKMFFVVVIFNGTWRHSEVISSSLDVKVEPLSSLDVKVEPLASWMIPYITNRKIIYGDT
jgi:hypothetical protein